MPKPKKQTWLLLLPAVLVVLCAMVWLFSSQEDAMGELTPADGVLDARGADFAHTVYTLGSDVLPRNAGQHPNRPARPGDRGA